MDLSPWIKSARPRTLSLSLTPYVSARLLPGRTTSRQIDLLVVLSAFLGSMFIQIGTNLHNDVVDSERGGDGLDRLGPLRVTASGLLSGAFVRRGAIVCFGLAALFGIYLVIVGGWQILVLGLLAILSGWTYTGGPLPIAYTPFGEMFVVAFFGIGAVCGTYWLCTQTLSCGSAGERVRPRAAEWRGTSGQQFSRHQSRCAGGSLYPRHCGGASANGLDLRGIYAVSICIVAAHRVCSSARARMADLCRTATDAFACLPLYARTAWPRIQSNIGQHSPNPIVVQRAT